MKALTLWQPWASLWAHQLKINETRSWATTYSGPLAVHAAKNTPLAPSAFLGWLKQHPHTRGHPVK